MLKQIKNLGLSIVIGSMIISSVPVNTYGLDIHNCHREMPGNTDVERIIDLYDYRYGDVTDQEESMLRQYSKYKKIKKASKELRNDYRKEMGEGLGEEILQYDTYCIDEKAKEIFPSFDKMTEERQDIIVHVMLYYFNKESKIKNTITFCVETDSQGHNAFISDKLMAMYKSDFTGYCPCQTANKGPIPKLTLNGAKAAVKRSYQEFANNNEATILSATESGDYITIEVEYDNNNYRKLKINKNTRIIESELKRNGEELAN